MSLYFAEKSTMEGNQPTQQIELQKLQSNISMMWAIKLLHQKSTFFQNPILVLREVVRTKFWYHGKILSHRAPPSLLLWSGQTLHGRDSQFSIARLMFRLPKPYSRGIPTPSPATSCPRTPCIGKLSMGPPSTPGGSSPRPTKSPSGARDGCQASDGLCLYLRRATWTPRTEPSPPTPGMSDSPTSCPPRRRLSTKPPHKIPITLWP